MHNFTIQMVKRIELMERTDDFLESILEISNDLRYAALYKNGILTARANVQIIDHTESALDRYEELFINPALLQMVRQRGNIDCGGLAYI